MEYQSKFHHFMELLNYYNQIVSKYKNTPRDYGAKEDLYETEAHLIQAIGDNTGLSLNDLAARTYRSNAAASMLVKSLAKKGFISRKRDPEDNRKYTLTLTPKGHKVYDFHDNYDKNKYSEILKSMRNYEDISEEDLEKSVKVLKALNSAARDILRDD